MNPTARPDGPDDLDGTPPSDPVLTRAYLETRTGLDSSAAADARVLAAAARAAGARPQAAGKPWHRRMALPFALAATVLLSVSVVTLVREARPTFEPAAEAVPAPPAAAPAAGVPLPAQAPVQITAPAPTPAPPSPASPPPEPARGSASAEPNVAAAPGVAAEAEAKRKAAAVKSGSDAQAKEATAQDAAKSVRDDHKPAMKKAAPVLRDQVAAAPPVFAEGTASAMGASSGAVAGRERKAESSADQAAERVAEVAVEKPESPRDERRAAPGAGSAPAAAAPAAPRAAAPPATARESAGNLAKSRTEQASSASVKEDAATPEAWLKLLRELRDTNKLAEARASAARFKARYPQAVIPEELRGLFVLP